MFCEEGVIVRSGGPKALGPTQNWEGAVKPSVGVGKGQHSPRVHCTHHAVPFPSIPSHSPPFLFTQP